MATLPSVDVDKLATLVSNEPALRAELDDVYATVAALDAKADTNAVEPLLVGGKRAARRDSHVVYFLDYATNRACGVDAAADTAAMHAALAAATAVRGKVALPSGTILIDGSLSLANYECSIEGAGTSHDWGGVNPGTTGTVFRAVNQTGPVLDFTAFRYPGQFFAGLTFEGFAVKGDGTPGAAKQGIRVGHSDVANSRYPISMFFRNIKVRDTGGTGFYAKDMYLGGIDDVVVGNPVDCVANNVPWVHLVGCNGMGIRGLGLRGMDWSAAGDVPLAGALRMEASTLAPSGYMLHDTLIERMWLEFLHIPSGSAAIVMQTNMCVLSDLEVFDCYKVVGATDTAYVRMEPSAVTDAGGNTWRGVIQGRDSNAAPPDYGCIITQDGNRIEGVKGYNGHNVRLMPGVKYTSVVLGGAVSGTTVLGWDDESGNDTNTLVDHVLGVTKLGARTGRPKIGLGPLIMTSGAGSPEGAVVANTGSMYMREDGPFGSVMYLKASGGDATNLLWSPVRQERMSTLTLSADSSISANVDAYRINLTANVSITSIGSPRVGGYLTLQIAQDAIGGRTLGWPAVVRFAGGLTPTLSTAPNRIDIFRFIYGNDGYWREISRTMGT